MHYEIQFSNNAPSIPRFDEAYTLNLNQLQIQ